MSRDRRCVFVSYDPKVTDVVVAALGGHGIAAHAMGRETLSSIFGFTAWPSPTDSHGGIEVWVADEKDAARARQILAELEDEKSAVEERQEVLGPIEAVCEQCGTKTVFPAKARGTIQNCPNCDSYTDVPGSSGR